MKKYILILFFILCLIACTRSTLKKEMVAERNLLDTLKILDTKLPEPQPGSWRYNRNEKDQTFEQYKSFVPLKKDSLRTIFYLQPIGDFDTFELKIIDRLSEYLAIFYDTKVKLANNISYGSISTYKIRFSSTGNNQILTTYVLDSILKPRLPKDAYMYMAITNCDLYAGDGNNFVFGQASYGGRVAVSSMNRFLYDTTQCLKRIIKTSCHEAGHMIGITHCTFAMCLMNGSNNLEELTERPCYLCSECTKKIHWSLNFGIEGWLEKLRQYYTRNGFQPELTHIKESQKILGLNKN